jgi:hypothetical protein
MRTPASPALLDLSAQLDAWRHAHPRRSRIPDHFWPAAVALWDRHSLSAISRHTRLRPEGLRKHAALSSAGRGGPRTAPASAFFPLAATAFQQSPNSEPTAPAPRAHPEGHTLPPRLRAR